jgi:hypothetical protein
MSPISLGLAVTFWSVFLRWESSAKPLSPRHRVELIGKTPLRRRLTFLDASGTSRLVMPRRKWEDYLTLAVTEIRECGSGAIQGGWAQPSPPAPGGSVEHDRAEARDRQGIGGPAESRATHDAGPQTGSRQWIPAETSGPFLAVHGDAVPGSRFRMTANGMIVSWRRRLLAHLRRRDADFAASEMEDHLGVLDYMWRLARYPARAELGVTGQPPW